MINSFRVQRIDDLAKPKEKQNTWIVIGYASAFFGGVLGVGIGWYLWNYEKTLPNGNKVYASSEQDRNNGRTMFLIGIISWVFWTYFYINMA